MCGIWGFLGESDSLEESFSKIQYRGPDYSKFLQINKNAFLGFHRLAIMDTSANGNQPFTYQEGNKQIFVVCNGEIYNYKQLIKDYDLELTSSSDCEVILHLYMKLGFYETVKLLDGVFSIILAEVSDGKTVFKVARDNVGVRPLFVGRNGDKIGFCSEMKGLIGICDKIDVFPPGHLAVCCEGEYQPESFYDVAMVEKYNMGNINVIKKQISNLFSESVRKRLMADRPIGSLLSGGLDSSLVSALVAKMIYPRRLKTFAVGMEGGTDFKYAKQVAEHIRSDHTEVVFTPEEGIDAIRDVIYALESYDITTIRASIGQFLLSKYISEKTNIKVVYNGDGSDELVMGYLYFHKAPSGEEAQDETIRLLEEIHKYDVLRVDRTISHHGLEARVPFLDRDFVNYYKSILPRLKVPTNGVEKYLLRSSFEDSDLLPNSVLWRKKEALSDGVSSTEKSWHHILQDHIETIVSDEEFEGMRGNYIHNSPMTKEAYHYRKVFGELFGEEHNGVIPHYWLPKWCGEGIVDPSARVLSVY